MGDRQAGQNPQVPIPVKIPVSTIRPNVRPVSSLVSPNIPRPQMVNQVYLLPKSGIGGALHPNTPSVMQVRSLATGQTMVQPNGVVSATHGTSRPATQPSGASGTAKLMSFFNQLLELSKKLPASTHSAVVALIQALVNGELDASSFCTQLRANLKSANTSMDIAPFIKDNIGTLRRDLLNGVCRLPNIQPPPKEIITSLSLPTVISVPGLAVTSSTTISHQMRQISATSSSVPAAPVGPRPAFAAQRVVGTIITSTPTPVVSSIIGAIPASRAPSSQPLLAPAPPRPSTSTPTISPATISSLGPVTKYRLAQPISSVTNPTSVAPILPNATATAVVPSRFPPAVSLARSGYPSLRPVITPSTPSSPANVASASKTTLPSTLSSLIRAKPAYSNSLPTTVLSSGKVLPISNTFVVETADRKLNETTSFGDDSRQRTSPSSDNPFFPPEKVKCVLESLGQCAITEDAITCLSHGLQVFIKSFLTRLRIVVSHRVERLSEDPRLTQVDFARDQLRFLQRLDEHDKIRQSELEKDLILKAAKSRGRNEDPDQMRMREMARKIATEDYEREKQHQANLTALHAIGPQRKRRFDTTEESGGTDLLTNSLSTRDSVSGFPTVISANNRLSLVSANRLGISVGAAGSTSSNLTHLGLDSNQNSFTLGSTIGSVTDNSANFPLTHGSRIHRATLRDMQTTLSRTPKLRRTRTFFRTHWRSHM